MWIIKKNNQRNCKKKYIKYCANFQGWKTIQKRFSFMLSHIKVAARLSSFPCFSSYLEFSWKFQENFCCASDRKSQRLKKCEIMWADCGQAR